MDFTDKEIKGKVKVTEINESDFMSTKIQEADSNFFSEGIDSINKKWNIIIGIALAILIIGGYS